MQSVKKNIQKRHLFHTIMSCFILIIVFAGCTNSDTSATETIPAGSVPASAADNNAKTTPYLSVWSAYWDFADASQELTAVSEQLKAVSYFEVYYNTNLEVIVPEQLATMVQEINQTTACDQAIRYLTVVNDFILPDGTFSLKDINHLRRLLNNQDLMDTHIDQLISLAEQWDADGLEIDYEALKKDYELWGSYMNFLIRLQTRCQQAGLKLRVVLEPGIPFDQVDFPEGIEYLVMCYNHHGPHNGPGPKADPQFLRDVISKSAANLPGPPIYAIATGGFDWNLDRSSVLAYTETAAAAKKAATENTTTRDADSQCIVFSYRDENYDRHEVWYADGVTLLHWRDIIRQEVGGNCQISLWRLGGNASISVFNQ